MSVVIISLSGRQEGNCAQISRHIQQVTGGTVYSLAELEIQPCGKCAYQCFQNGQACPYIEDDVYSIFDVMTHSQQVYFVLPNYCDYPCANYFILNERSLCYFQNHPELLEKYTKVPKKAVIVSNTGRDHFIDALAQQGVTPENILFLRAADYGKRSIAGDLMTSPEVMSTINTFIDSNK